MFGRKERRVIMNSNEKATLNADAVINAANLRLIASISEQSINKILENILACAKIAAEKGLYKSVTYTTINNRQFQIVKQRLNDLDFSVGSDTRDNQVVEVRLSW